MSSYIREVHTGGDLIRKGEFAGVRREYYIRRSHNKGFEKGVRFFKSEMVVLTNGELVEKCDKAPGLPPRWVRISEEEAKRLCTPKMWATLCPEAESKEAAASAYRLANLKQAMHDKAVSNMDINELERFVKLGGSL